MCLMQTKIKEKEENFPSSLSRTPINHCLWNHRWGKKRGLFINFVELYFLKVFNCFKFCYTIYKSTWDFHITKEKLEEKLHTFFILNGKIPCYRFNECFPFPQISWYSLGLLYWELWIDHFPRKLIKWFLVKNFLLTFTEFHWTKKYAKDTWRIWSASYSSQ